MLVPDPTTAPNPTEPPRSLPARSGLLASGLGAGWLGGVLTVSVVAFLFWGGPLWRVPAGGSHLARIAGSYLLVVPLTAAALLVTKRWSSVRLVSSVGLVWSAKFIATATLYLLLAPSAGNDYAPRVAAPTAAVGAPRHYRPAPSAPSATWTGVVLDGDSPLEGAVVLVEDPPAGRGLDAPRDVALVLGAAGARPMTVAATTRDRVIAENHGPELHTLRLVKSSAPGALALPGAPMVANLPLPPGAPPAELPALEPGAYTWSCGVHGDVGGTLVVVDHPYVAPVEADGRVSLTGVPLGELHLVAAKHGRAPARLVVNVDGDTQTTWQTKGTR